MAVIKVTDVEGYAVVLEDERWQHILEGHPEMAENRDLLVLTMEKPELIYRDPERKEVHYYYRLAGRSILRANDIYISAVVERSEGNKVARVKTAFFVKRPRKNGVLVWFGRKS